MDVALYIIVLLVYFAVMIFIGVKNQRSAKSVHGYVLGGRSVGPWLSAFAYGTSYFSAVIFIGYAGQFGWNFGIAATWIGIGNAVLGSLLAWAVLGRRTRVMTQQLDSATMPDYFGKRFSDDKLKIAASVIIFIFLIPYTASLYKGLGSLFAMAFDIPYWVCILIMAAVTAVYVLIGGYMATVWNDFIQGIIMLFGIVIIVVAVLMSRGGLMEALTQLSQISSGDMQGAYTSFFGPDLYGLIMVVILTSLGTWGLPQMVQKFYAIKSEGAIKKGMIISTVFALVVAGGCYFLGGFGRLFMEDASAGYDSIIPAMLSESLPVVLIALVLILVVSASMSTLSSLVMSSSSTLTLDLIKGVKKDLKPKSQMFLIRLFVAMFIVISAVIAIVYDAYGLSFIAQMMGVSWGALAGAFLAPYLFSLYWKKTSRASCWACFAFGVATSIAALVISLCSASLPASFIDSFIYKYFFGSSIYVGAWTMLAGFVIVPVVSLFTGKQKTEEKNKLDKLFKPFEELTEAVETAADGYLTKELEPYVLREPSESAEQFEDDEKEGESPANIER
ncbi:MAG TPA: sodium/solute symporter [Candidatus Borkfalkia avistercoris]|uniref:Sodium/solute symporter n=1 Tax=Candidatus Borkfalkia avistercoris TaxID=2838504 RepID=A0A9D2CYB8_9FIRM|nr:sodium/solute symporter [Candidatus Borkfalkia avistercoris]